MGSPRPCVTPDCCQAGLLALMNSHLHTQLRGNTVPHAFVICHFSAIYMQIPVKYMSFLRVLNSIRIHWCSHGGSRWCRFLLNWEIHILRFFSNQNSMFIKFWTSSNFIFPEWFLRTRSVTWTILFFFFLRPAYLIYLNFFTALYHKSTETEMKVSFFLLEPAVIILINLVVNIIGFHVLAN